MNRDKPTVDLEYPTSAHGHIPAFHKVEEEAEFWDAYDTAEFSEEFTLLEAVVSPELRKS